MGGSDPGIWRLKLVAVDSPSSRFLAAVLSHIFWKRTFSVASILSWMAAASASLSSSPLRGSLTVFFRFSLISPMFLSILGTATFSRWRKMPVKSSFIDFRISCGLSLILSLRRNCFITHLPLPTKGILGLEYLTDTSW
ncbi:hypothetical protein K438DRAFT_570962 [Mycena galopus ATCC 62051]|nr:hypothetical protein K438DRAFT_570962 [Mycena galopus ATCC 62051]